MMDLEKIKKTFTIADEYSAGIACLISIIKYYDRGIPADWLRRMNAASIQNTTLAEIKELAIQMGFDAKITILKTEQLKVMQTPTIIFFENELGNMDFAVCYGFDGKRFVVGEPKFGLMKYFSREVERMWIKGISLILFPALLEGDSENNEERGLDDKALYEVREK